MNVHSSERYMNAGILLFFILNTIEIVSASQHCSAVPYLGLLAWLGQARPGTRPEQLLRIYPDKKKTRFSPNFL
jgi:hypothetical protein